MVHEHIGPFSPTNATAATLWYEQAAIDGDGFGNIAYGVVLTLFIMTVPLLWKSRQERPLYSYGTLLYAFLVFACASIETFRTMHFEEQQFVDDVNFPGGPVAFNLLNNDMVTFSAIVVNTWLQDGMIIWRFIVFYGYVWWLAIVPCIFYLVSVAFSIVVLWGLSHSATYLSIYRFSTTYLSISVATSVILSFAIVARLLWMRHQLRQTIGNDHASPYLSVSAMVIESAFIYVIIALPHTVMLGLQNTGQILTVRLIAQVQAIAPLLIIYRVAQGRAWSRQTVRYATGAPGAADKTGRPSMPIHFAHASQVGSTTHGGSTTKYTNGSNSAVGRPIRTLQNKDTEEHELYVTKESSDRSYEGAIAV